MGPPIHATVDLYWIPLGAGDHVVRLCGKAYEAVAARVTRRRSAPLFHTALVVAIDGTRWAIESAPIRDDDGPSRGVVAEGPVGIRAAGRLRVFRYEIRRWRDGVIPDAGEAVGGPVRVAADAARAERVLELVASVPTPVWGRDELRAGEMWNSNSLTSWLLVRAGIDVRALAPPAEGRAPGWNAGIVVARRLAVTDAGARLPGASGVARIPRR
ncbi:MAG TPA: hypothetical protein VLA82_05450 [Actinomycetota bacterium]|nr:hypothetical protein [Actinomycetota bacterium]